MRRRRPALYLPDPEQTERWCLFPLCRDAHPLGPAEPDDAAAPARFPVVGKRKSGAHTPNRVTLSAARLPPSQASSVLGFAPRPCDRFALSRMRRAGRSRRVRTGDAEASRSRPISPDSLQAVIRLDPPAPVFLIAFESCLCNES